MFRARSALIGAARVVYRSLVNIDLILETLNRHDVEYILLGGMNFLLRHKPVLTFDVDVWINDTAENRACCETALGQLDASWGATDEEWRPVVQWKPGWLARQSMFCMTSPHGAIDVFRSVKGLGSWSSSAERAAQGRTASGVPCLGLCDEDMLACQYALDETERKLDRVKVLEEALGNHE